MKTTYTSMQHPGQMPGAYWKIDDIDLAITDGGYSLMKQFINENPHEDFNLSIYDAITHTTAEIYCSLEEMPQIVSNVYHLERATPMMFIGENIISGSYVVGMHCTRGILSLPGVYKAKDGRLFDAVTMQ